MKTFFFFHPRFLLLFTTSFNDLPNFQDSHLLLYVAVICHLIFAILDLGYGVLFLLKMMPNIATCLVHLANSSRPSLRSTHFS